LAIAQNRLQHHPLPGRDRQPGTGLQEQITRAAFVRPIQCDPDAALPDPQHTRHLGRKVVAWPLASDQKPAGLCGVGIRDCRASDGVCMVISGCVFRESMIALPSLTVQ
jgi:hypothetical protein